MRRPISQGTMDQAPAVPPSRNRQYHLPGLGVPETRTRHARGRLTESVYQPGGRFMACVFVWWSSTRLKI